MFTGIIDHQGRVIRKVKSGNQVTFTFRVVKPLKNFKTGQSIAVNGVCLTAAKVVKNSFQADVIRETLEATTLGDLQAGDVVNLERSLRLGEELGGHFVTGHVDGKGKVLAVKKQKKNHTYIFEAPPAVVPFLAPKGSMAVDGISLTVQSVKGPRFTAGIIPHTWKVTTFKRLKAGDWVNLEVDLVARYLKTLDASVTAPKPSRIRLKSLLSHGF